MRVLRRYEILGMYPDLGEQHQGWAWASRVAQRQRLFLHHLCLGQVAFYIRRA